MHLGHSHRRFQRNGGIANRLVAIVLYFIVLLTLLVFSSRSLAGHFGTCLCYLGIKIRLAVSKY